MRSHRQRHPKVGVAATMLRSPPPPRLKVVDLNPHLSCILCGGYFIDATTVTECLHSFCRACIVRYLETSEYCPVCEVQVHKSKPLRSDKILQDIVYKLVPGLFHNEMKRRRELYASQPPEALKESRDAEDRGECLDQKFIYASDEIFSLSIEYGKEVENKDSTPEEDNVPKRRFLRCPAAVTISHLKKFVKMKYGIPNSYEVDLKYDKEIICDDYTLIDVAYIFLWQRRGPMRFFYKITERPPKIKSERRTEFMEVETPAEESEKDATTTKDTEARAITRPEPTPVRQDEDVAAVVLPDGSSPVPVPADPAAAEQRVPAPCESRPRAAPDAAAAPVHNPPPPPPPPPPVEGGKDVAAKEESKTEKPKSVTPFKFPPVSLQLAGKSTAPDTTAAAASSSRPVVMTVAPLTKPSTSLPTTTTTSPPTITHGTYTGISIKKSPPNTLPPFKISSHLLAPRVPPLKLSPPRFSKLEHCLRELKKSSASSKKSKSSRDKLELKVAQLKSSASSVKCVAPLVITVPPEAKLLDNRIRDSGHCTTPHEKRSEVLKSPAKAPPPVQPKVPTPPPPPPPPEKTDTRLTPEPDDKMDLDSDLFEGPLVIAEPPDIPQKDESDVDKQLPTAKDESFAANKPEDSEDEEIDVVDDGEADSGRGSDVSSRTEARSLCGFDDDLGSPDSVPKTPEAERSVGPPAPNHSSFPDPKSPTTPRTNGAAPKIGNDCGVLDLSTCGRKRCHDGEMPTHHRTKQVANPAVLDKTRQNSTPCISPNPTPFKVIGGPELSHHHRINHHLYGKAAAAAASKHDAPTGRGNFKCRGNTLTVINPDPNGSRPKIVIRNLGPRPDRGHERFHHHHHHHHQNHHQRM